MPQVCGIVERHAPFNGSALVEWSFDGVAQNTHECPRRALAERIAVPSQVNSRCAAPSCASVNTAAAKPTTAHTIPVTPNRKESPPVCRAAALLC